MRKIAALIFLSLLVILLAFLAVSAADGTGNRDAPSPTPLPTTLSGFVTSPQGPGWRGDRSGERYPQQDHHGEEWRFYPARDNLGCAGHHRRLCSQLQGRLGNPGPKRQRLERGSGQFGDRH